MSKVKLSREVSLILLILYGLGNILGAGIYVLIGKIAGISGYYSLISFLLACVVALFTALSYMELASRYPVSAGVAVYVQEGIGLRTLSIAVGVLIAAAGLVSSAALVNGFVGYLRELIDINAELSITLLIFILVAVSIKGIKASVILASVLTIIEVFGLLLIIYYGFDGIINVKINITDFVPKFDFSDISIILMGTFLAFYAFLGFEDMVNIAEEVKEPSKTYPIAIISALAISTILYILVLLVAFDTLSLDELKNSHAPFADIYKKLTNNDPILISIIGMFAVVNGALIQIIMASRIVYGMAEKSLLPSYFCEVDKSTKTPVRSTVFVGLIATAFALNFDIVSLASFTSMLILIVFTLVNFSLIRIKLRNPHPKGIIKVPLLVPIFAIALNLILIFMSIFGTK